MAEYETRAAAEKAMADQISDAYDEMQNGNLGAAAMWAGLASDVYLVEIEPWAEFPADKPRTAPTESEDSHGEH